MHRRTAVQGIKWPNESLPYSTLSSLFLLWPSSSLVLCCYLLNELILPNLRIFLVICSICALPLEETQQPLHLPICSQFPILWIMSSRFCAVASGKRLSGSILSGGLLGQGTPIRSPQSQPVPGKIDPSFLYFSSLFKLLTLGMSLHVRLTQCFCQNLCPWQGRFIPVLHKPQRCSEVLYLGWDAWCLCKWLLTWEMRILLLLSLSWLPTTLS